jgi:adenine-specific DNA-methyltransferase
MDKLKMHSPNLTDENVAKIRDLFPSCVTEAVDETGKLRLMVDFDQLRQELSEDVVEGPQERYRLEWPGKREALALANAPIAKTLRPARDESLEFDKTKNLFIEADNLDALKLLQQIYLGKVKLIYIDPPYNTGKDFIYDDNFSESAGEYMRRSNQSDEDRNKLVANPESNGRFHSDWMSMLYARLKIARNLLSHDGVIFISIDDIEKANLRKLADEVFGAENFLAEMVVLTGANQSGDGVKIQTNTEYCMAYCRSSDEVRINRVDKVDESLRNLNDAPTPLITRPDMGYTIYFNPETNKIVPKHDYDKSKIYENTVDDVYVDDLDLISLGFRPIRPGFRGNKLHRWRWGIDTFIERLDEVVIEADRSGKNYVPKFRQSGFNAPKNILQFSSGTTEVSNIFDGHKIFDFPKSTKLIRRLLDIGADKDSVILDFFAGSATTAEAVIAANAADGGTRQFILIQLDAETAPESEARNLGYLTITQVAKERIRRAGKRILEGECHAEWSGDVGFRVLKVDTSNLRDVYYRPDQTDQNDLLAAVDNIKPDRTVEDLLFQVLTDWGVDLTLSIRREAIHGKTVFFVDDNALVACFDTGVTEELVKALAGRQPLRVVFRDNGFVSDAVKINVEQIFRQLSPNTDIKSI